MTNGIQTRPFALSFMLLGMLASAALAAEQAKPKMDEEVTQGALRIAQKDGAVVECPLKHTDVKADVSGFIARVTVRQTFHNPTNEKIEAVYVFPLPHEAAVDDMTMVIGERKIVGVIKRRADARAIYERAIASGQTAALLEQERPNIFTQSVGNIEPGQDIHIEISYVDVLKYDMGVYEFHFPMVVGPRYNPGRPISPTPLPNAELQGKVGPLTPNTDRVPDAARINPPVLRPEQRNGHDVSLSLTLNAGVPVQDLKVANHKASIDEQDDRRAVVKLDAGDSIPNKDFILRYKVTGQKPEMALLAHTPIAKPEALGGYFMLMVQPKEDERLTQSPPREIVFLIDVSGSMSGEPTATSIAAMKHMLALCREGKDTVQVVTFASQAAQLFETPVPVNPENIQRALRFTEMQHGRGGTEMLKGVKMAMDQPIDKERVRIIVMLTDGYIGNEAEIIEHVGKACGDQVRFWTIGVGQAPNMFLIDGVAKQGGGMGKKLGLKDDAQALAQEVVSRIQRAQLAKIRIDWGDLNVRETYPARIPELWAGRPVIVFGRYRGGNETKITLSGSIEGQPASWPLAVNLPVVAADNAVLAPVWARQKIESLMQQTYYQGSPAIEEMVTEIALRHRLMSQYTSFVAVDQNEAKRLIEPARPPRRMLVPVPLPEGTRWEGFFGGEGEENELAESLNIALGVQPAMQNRAYFALSAAPESLRAVPMPVVRAKSLDSLSRARGGGMGGGGSALRRQEPAMQQLMRSGVANGITTRGLYAGRRAPLAEQLSQITDYTLAFDAPATQPAGLASVIDDRFTFNALAQETNTLSKPAADLLTAARELRKKGDLPAARAAFLKAYFLDTAGMADGETAAAALEAISQIHVEQAKTSAQTLPLLDRRLDLVIRDKSLPEALAMIDPSIQIIPGSIADAEQLSGDPVYVSYLDLRNATAVQALDWLTQLNRLTWWVADGKVVVGSERRNGGAERPWVYDVSLIALPDAKELVQLNDHQKAVAEAKSQADRFIKTIRSAVTLKDGSAIEWYAPGQILVIGTPDFQESIAKLLADLANPTLTLNGDLAALHKLTAARATQRKEAVAKRDASRRLYELASSHARHGLALLSEAADSKLDLEALTELQIAWKNPRTAELLAGTDTRAVMRSLYAICEASRALPNDAELADLARSTLLAAKPSIDRDLATLAKPGERGEPFSLTLLQSAYGVLATRDPQQVEQLRTVLAGLTAPQSASTLGTILRPLLNPPTDADRVALANLVKQGVHGDDLILITALSCRRSGGEAWETLRAEAKDLLGDQPLSGSVVVLINRLSATPLPITAQAR